jgi:predicted AAA+ superfamily ATPase
MYTLDIFFNNPPKLENYHSRKVELPDSSFLLYGPRGAGKSALIANYMKTLKKESFLYIDAQDPIFVLEDIDISELEKYIEEESIKTLILDHYFEGFLEYMPKIEQLIVVTRQKIDLDLPSIVLYPLDFEEFFNFQKAHLIQQNFSLYTKYGSLPQLALSHSPFAYKELFFEKFDTQDGKVMLILALFHTKIATSHQVYQQAKIYFKISKDWLYKAIKRLEQEGILYQIETFEKGFGKKVILYDFAFAKYLNKTLNFNAIFDSIVALALIKHNIDFKAVLNPLGYYTSKGELILISPFESEDSFWAKIQKNFGFYSNLKLQNITIVTVSNSYSFTINNITFNAIAFSEWVITQDE